MTPRIAWDRPQAALGAVLGALIGVPLFLGSLLANVPWLAVATIGGLGAAATRLAARSRRVGVVKTA